MFILALLLGTAVVLGGLWLVHHYLTPAYQRPGYLLLGIIWVLFLLSLWSAGFREG